MYVNLRSLIHRTIQKFKLWFYFRKFELTNFRNMRNKGKIGLKIIYQIEYSESKQEGVIGIKKFMNMNSGVSQKHNYIETHLVLNN